MQILLGCFALISKHPFNYFYGSTLSILPVPVRVTEKVAFSPVAALAVSEVINTLPL
jgi:hypothetical protein